MLILFVLGILVVGSVLMINILSIFFPFFQQLGSITNYNRSYYGAISGIERGLLVLKNHEPGFEGSGGWIKQNSFGPFSDTGNRQAFGIISRPNNSMNWEIKSRTPSSSIPIAGESNIDSDYVQGNEDFNKLSYSNPRGVSLFGNNLSNLERVYLYYDDTKNQTDGNVNLYYTGVREGSIIGLKTSDVKVNISIPTLKNQLGDLNINSDVDGDGTIDDTLVSRSLVGKERVSDPVESSNFSIKQIQNFSQDPSGTSYKVNLGDTAIRESDINEMTNPGSKTIIFGEGKFLFDRSSRGDPSLVPLAGSTPDDIAPKYHNINPVNSALSGSSFEYILQSSEVKNLTLNFGLINLPKVSNGKSYPFLRYKVMFPTSTNIPNSHYYISGKSNAGNHDVEILVKKPTSNTSIFSDFSIIF